MNKQPPHSPKDKAVLLDSAKTRRIAWSGLTPEELARPGSALIAQLLQEANNQGLQLQQLATRLDVTYGYIAQLRNGFRKPCNISDAFAAKCAKFLGVPRITVLLAAGRVSPEDFYDHGDTLGRKLDRALEHIARDNQWDLLVPPVVFRGDQAMKLFAVRAYEKATGATLLPGEVLVAFPEATDTPPGKPDRNS